LLADDLEDQHAESPGSGDDGSSCRVQGQAWREMVRVEAWPTTASSVRCYRSPIGDRKIRTAEHRRPGPPWAPGPGRNQDIATLFLSIAVATTLAGAPRRLVTTTT
jgi:hypothetical protein